LSPGSPIATAANVAPSGGSRRPESGLALPARRWQCVRRQRVGAARRVDEHRLLRAAPARRGLEGVALLVGKRGRVDVVPRAWRTQPSVDSTTVTGSDVTSSSSAIAWAAARSTIFVRRGSPYSFASGLEFVADQRSELAARSSASSRACPALPASSFCSPRIFISSSFARWRSLVSRIASACGS
jgi:hypothetical protein